MKSLLQIPLDLQTGFYAALLLLLTPFMAVKTSLRLEAATQSISGKRLRRQQIVPQMILLGVTLWVAYIHSVPIWSPPLAGPATVASLSIGALGMVTLIQWLLWKSRTDAERRRMWVRKFLPTSSELPEWIGLCCLAAVTEELAYRGLLFGIIAGANQSPWLGALLSAIAFGAAHFLQGKRSMLGIGVIGLVFQGLTWWTGSLIPAMAVHAMANILAGIFGPRRFKALGDEAIA